MFQVTTLRVCGDVEGFWLAVSSRDAEQCLARGSRVAAAPLPWDCEWRCLVNLTFRGAIPEPVISRRYWRRARRRRYERRACRAMRARTDRGYLFGGGCLESRPVLDADRVAFKIGMLLGSGSANPGSLWKGLGGTCARSACRNVNRLLRSKIAGVSACIAMCRVLCLTISCV